MKIYLAIALLLALSGCATHNSKTNEHAHSWDAYLYQNRSPASATVDQKVEAALIKFSAARNRANSAVPLLAPGGLAPHLGTDVCKLFAICGAEVGSNVSGAEQLVNHLRSELKWKAGQDNLGFDFKNKLCSRGFTVSELIATITQPETK